MIEHFANFLSKPKSISGRLCYNHVQAWQLTQEIKVWLDRANAACLEKTTIIVKQVRLQIRLDELKNRMEVTAKNAKQALYSDKLVEANNWISDFVECKLDYDTAASQIDILKRCDKALTDLSNSCVAHTANIQCMLTTVKNAIALQFRTGTETSEGMEEELIETFTKIIEDQEDTLSSSLLELKTKESALIELDRNVTIDTATSEKIMDKNFNDLKQFFLILLRGGRDIDFVAPLPVKS